MIKLQKSLSVAVVMASMALGLAATSTSASAFGRFGGFHHGGLGTHSCWGHCGWGGGRWHIGGWGGYHRWGYGSPYWYGARYAHYAWPVAVAPRACPIGQHLGYEGKYCWPNR